MPRGCDTGDQFHVITARPDIAPMRLSSSQGRHGVLPSRTTLQTIDDENPSTNHSGRRRAPRAAVCPPNIGDRARRPTGDPDFGWGAQAGERSRAISATHPARRLSSSHGDQRRGLRFHSIAGRRRHLVGRHHRRPAQDPGLRPDGSARLRQDRRSAAVMRFQTASTAHRALVSTCSTALN